MLRMFMKSYIKVNYTVTDKCSKESVDMIFHRMVIKYSVSSFICIAHQADGVMKIKIKDITTLT